MGNLSAYLEKILVCVCVCVPASSDTAEPEWKWGCKNIPEITNMMEGGAERKLGPFSSAVLKEIV